MQGVQEQLKRGEPLLAVDDGVLRHFPGAMRNLLKHHCADEMRLGFVVRPF